MKKGYKRISDEELFNHIDKKMKKLLPEKREKFLLVIHLLFIKQ